MNEQDNNGTVSAPPIPGASSTQDDMIKLGRQLVRDGASLSNLAGRAVFARLDETDRALAERLTELLSLREHSRGQAAQVDRLQDLAGDRLNVIRRLRSQRDQARRELAEQRTPPPADLYGGPQQQADAGPFEGILSGFRQSAEQIEQDGPALPGFLRDTVDGLFGAPTAADSSAYDQAERKRRDDTIELGAPPRELLDLLFGEGNDAPDGVTVGNGFGVMIPRDAETDEDGIPHELRERLTREGLVQPGDRLVRVADGTVAILGSQPCGNPDCGACAAVEALSGSQSSARDAGKDSAPGRLNAAQVRDLAPGTWFRMVEMEGKTIPAHVLPIVQRTFGPLVSASAVFELLTPEGTPVPAETARNERKAFEQIMRELDKRSARFEIVG